MRDAVSVRVRRGPITRRIIIAVPRIRWRREISAAPDLRQLGPDHELGTDRPIVLVGTTGFGVGPGESAADRRVVVLRVYGADVVPEEDAAPALHPRSPFPPACPIEYVRPVDFADAGRLVVAQRDAVGAARR